METDEKKYYCTTVDIIGQKELGKINFEYLEDSLRYFKVKLDDNKDLLSEDADLLIFSESAFVIDTDFNKLLDFINKVKTDLFNLGCYCRVTMYEENFTSRPVKFLNTQKEKEDSATQKEKEGPIRFGVSLENLEAKLISLHYEFKGIGIYTNEITSKKFINSIENIYIPVTGHRQYFGFQDMKLNYSNLTSSGIENFFKIFLNINTITKHTGRYLIPLFVNLILSLDEKKIADFMSDYESFLESLNNIDHDEGIKKGEKEDAKNEEKQKWLDKLDDDSQKLFIYLFIQNIQIFKNIVGIENVIFAFVNRLLLVGYEFNNTDFFTNKIFGLKRVIEHINLVPTFLLDISNKRKFNDSYFKNHIEAKISK